MPNFPGAKTYPMLTGRTALVDTATRTNHTQTGFARGVTTPDYNANLRGLYRRIDKIPRPPYP